MSPCFRLHGWILSGLCVCEYLRNEIMNMQENHGGSLQLIKILREFWKLGNRGDWLELTKQNIIPETFPSNV